MSFFDSVIIPSSWKGHRFVSHLKVFPLSDVSLWHGIWPALVSAEPHVLAEFCRPLVDDTNHSTGNTACCPNNNLFVDKYFFSKQFICPQVKIYKFTVLINPKSKLTVFLIYLCTLPPQPQPNFAMNGTPLVFDRKQVVRNWNRLFADLWYHGRSCGWNRLEGRTDFMISTQTRLGPRTLTGDASSLNVN